MHKQLISSCAVEQGAVEDNLFGAAPQAAPGSTE